MANGDADSRLARRLQKRGAWASYSACLRIVRERMKACPTESKAELAAAIDAGELDPAPQ